MKIETKVYLTADLARALDEMAIRTRRPKSEVVRAAVASFLSPDGSERMEAAVTRRLDRMSRQIERLERDIGISNEALGLFIRAWLTATPPMPDAAQAPAQAKGRERYEGFIEALGRRLASGQSLAREITQDLEGQRD
ncbi:ribbon-helix-helix protein, CopG family [Phenylobacterium sp.]|uniref:ribbon-helix-helix protein, CopG family n=1 Tax=Phenylobacterium sp. TaxID=1871053 RepID=UPI003D2ABA09